MERSTLTATVDQCSKNGQQYFGQSIGSFVATAQLMGVRAQGIAAIATPNDQRRSFKGRYQAQQGAFIKSGCSRKFSHRNGLGPLANSLNNRQGWIDGLYAPSSFRYGCWADGKSHRLNSIHNCAPLMPLSRG